MKDEFNLKYADGLLSLDCDFIAIFFNILSIHNFNK